MTLDELQKLCDEATPGVWLIDHPGNAERAECAYISMPGENGLHQILVDHRRDLSDPVQDARFIAASRTYMPKLIAVAKLAKAKRDWSDAVICSEEEAHVAGSCNTGCPACGIDYDLRNALSELK